MADTNANYDAWREVLNLVLNEQADAMIVAGDMTYDDDPSKWWSLVERKLGNSFPVFLSMGNHDIDQNKPPGTCNEMGRWQNCAWERFQERAVHHLRGAERVPSPLNDATFGIWFRQLNIVTIRAPELRDRPDKGLPTPEQNRQAIQALFSTERRYDYHWKLCVWHENMSLMRVSGPANPGDASKNDVMGWAPYKECLDQGAIIVTGHDHNYARTYTLSIPDETPTRDWSCARDAADGGSGEELVCVGPKRSFVTVSGLGGADREITQCNSGPARCPRSIWHEEEAVPGCPHRAARFGESCEIWDSIYDFAHGAKPGAQFLVFDGATPKRASGYFLNTDGERIDNFDIHQD